MVENGTYHLDRQEIKFLDVFNGLQKPIVTLSHHQTSEVVIFSGNGKNKS